METTKVREKIKAGVVFERGEPRPKWFFWKGKKRDVKEITYTWRTVEGEAVIVHFSIIAGDTYYEITFNQKTMDWVLEQVAAEG